MLITRCQNLVSPTPAAKRFRRLDRDPTDQILTNLRSWHSFRRPETKQAQARELRPFNHFGFKAGDRIRTDDVQLGKLAFYH